MIFTTPNQLFDYIRENQTLSSRISKARKYHKLLLALIDGEGFKELLINQIVHIEGTEKAIARKKYARSIKDFYERLLRLTDNIYSSTGGVKRYENLSDNQILELEEHLHNIKGGKSLESWLESVWLTVYHQDPNGIIFLEYDAALGIKPQPSYRSINTIRNYIPNGQKLEVLIFEPVNLDSGVVQWEVVDDKRHYIVNQKGESFIILPDESFEHEFGVVPAVINSDIEHIGHDSKLTPVDKVVEISTEYAVDLSVKTIYKFQQGFPRHWRYGKVCVSCQGLKKDGKGDVCGSCNGTGELHLNDVTHEDVLIPPEEGEVSLVPGSGHVSPDIEYLAEARTEIQELEDTATFTHWGAVIDTKKVATATEIDRNIQPAKMRLNKYADAAEGVQTLLTEMIANHMFIDKDKDVRVASIHLGRNFIIETTEVVLLRYETAKTANDNTVILDRLFQEYLLTKHKGDNVGLQIAIKKSKAEPYIHFSIDQIKLGFPTKEIQRKILFNDWWKTLSSAEQKGDDLKGDFDSWFDSVYEEPKVEEPVK
jgi:hypothetical protein